MTAKAATPTKKTKTTKPKTSATKAASKTKAKSATAAKPKTTQQPAAGKVKDDKSKLKQWHLVLGVVLLVEAVAVVVAGAAKTIEVTTQYLSKDTLATEAAGGSAMFATATRHLADVPLAWMVASFLLVFGATFVLLATVWRKHYEAWLEHGTNNMRWLAYGIGAGLMTVTIAALSGVTDLGYLALIFSALAIPGLLLTIVEPVSSDDKLRKKVAVVALCTAALPVLVIGLGLKGVLFYGGNLPVYVYFIYGSMLLAAMAFVMAYSMRMKRRGRFMDTVYSEKAFILIGFGAATVLALQIFTGALQP